MWSSESCVWVLNWRKMNLNCLPSSRNLFRAKSSAPSGWWPTSQMAQDFEGSIVEPFWSRLTAGPGASILQMHLFRDIASSRKLFWQLVEASLLQQPQNESFENHKWQIASVATLTSLLSAVQVCCSWIVGPESGLGRKSLWRAID